MLRCILVDDEPLARERLRALLAESAEPVEIVAEADSGRAALALVQEHRPDLLFLDISMPGLDGFDVAELMRPHRPFIVFVTAYDEHALRAFDVQAVGYLTKPVRATALDRTLRHVATLVHRDETTPTPDAAEAPEGSGPLNRLAVHQGRRLRIVPAETIRWLEARDRQVYARVGDAEHPVDFTLDELEERLDPESFLRIHRSYIVNTHEVRELVPWFAGSALVKLDDGTQLPVARRRVRAVRGLLGGR